MCLYNRFCKRFFAAVIIRLTAQSDSRAPPKWFRNVFKFATDLRVKATKGSIIVARFGMNFCTKLVVPRTERSCLIVVGVFKSIMALTQSSPLRIPLADKTCPMYWTSFDPKGILDGFNVRPAA